MAAKKTPAKKAAKKAAKKSLAPWVEPEADGVCPGTHPIKAKLSSRIFHVPGGLSYLRTRPDRCYSTEEAALGDGLTKAKK